MFNTLYQEFIYKRTYARWIESENRRENWDETVDRYKDFFIQKVPEGHTPEFLNAIDLIKKLEVLPSMRALWTAGKALERENLCGYNCGYITIDTLKSFADMLYILMNGTGIGFSVERQYINQLPTVPEQFKKSDTIISFVDSKRGWAEGYFKVLKELYKGNIPEYDLSKIRPAGSRLKTFGGLAAGSEPLEKLINFTVKVITHNNGKKLSSINCYDLCCMVANIVVSGGVRRSACVSFSNLSDSRMSHAKRGAFWIEQPQRALSNNSTMYTEKPDARKFLSEWIKLIESKTGERGVFNRHGAKLLSARSGRRDINHEFGGNACLEIILRPNQLCNLTEVVIRKKDTLKILKEKVRAATILGCIQSTLTNFKFLSRKWKQNCEDERLLGVSLTGEMDHPVLNNINKKMKTWLHEMKEEAIATAAEWSKYLDINMPTAITAIKPSGTASQLSNTSSGIHTRYAPYYIRRVRVSSLDPLAKFLISKQVPVKPETGSVIENTANYVFEFPIKSPETSRMRDEMTTLQQLEIYKVYMTYWVEHSISTTIYVKDEEWPEVAAWVYKNWDTICGLSFLPYDTGIYELAPYEEISEEEFKELEEAFPKTIDFKDLDKFETEDNTEGAQTLACTGNNCEI